MGREVLNRLSRRAYNRAMPATFAKCALIAIAFVAATSVDAQRSHRRRVPKESEAVARPLSLDKRDSIVALPGPYSGRPYWLALAQCGGIYFKLNMLYTDAAVHVRVVKPDPRANADYTKKINAAIRVATTFLDAAENFLRIDRGLDRDNAILTYDEQSRTAGDRVKTIDGAVGVVKTCPALYEACRSAYPKACSEPLVPMD
jgi:hypothetical protein